MLTVATLAMVGYGLYAVAAGAVDLFGPSSLETLADLIGIVFGSMLIVAARLVRVLVPGGLALAIGAMLGLQAIAIHNAAHLDGRVVLAPQFARGAFAALLVLLAHLGGRVVVRRRRAGPGPHAT